MFLFKPAKSVLFTIHFSLFTISRITFFALKCNFFWKIFVISKNIFIFAPVKSALEWVGGRKDLLEKRPEAIRRAGLWKTFSNVTRLCVKLSNFETRNSGNATETSACGWYLYSRHARNSIIYIIRCTSSWGISVYICVWGYWAQPYISYRLAWADFMLFIFF